MDVDERAFLERLLELGDQFIAHRRQLRVASGCDLLAHRKVTRRLGLIGHRLHHDLVTLEGLLRVLSSYGHRLKVREPTALAREPGVNATDELAREHLIDAQRPVVPARARPRAQALSRTRFDLLVVAAFSGKLEEQVKGLALPLLLGRVQLLTLLELAQELARPRRQASTLPAAHGLRTHAKQAPQSRCTTRPEYCGS